MRCVRAQLGVRVMEYEHKGIKIAFDATSAEFSAHVAGRFKRSTSLAAIKKAIDKSQTFAAFDALRAASWESKDRGENYVPCRVIGIEKPRGAASYRNRPLWIIDSGSTKSELWVDTPENRAAIDKYVALVKHQEAERERMTKERSEADDAIQCVQFPK